jgi:hypothetical protein
MTKSGICLAILATVAASGLATAQSSGAKRNPDLDLKTATQPLMPKSEIAPRKSSGPTLPASNHNTNQELTKVERQKLAGANSSKTTSPPIKLRPEKSAPANSGSGINASYQKPRIPK